MSVGSATKLLAFATAIAIGWTPAAARAATRYAAPAASGALCTQLVPCDVGTAVNAATSGDTVLLAAGSYGTPSSRISTVLDDQNKTLLIRGATPGDPPTIWFTELGRLALSGAGSQVENLQLEADGTAGPLIVHGSEVARRVDRVRARNTASNGAGCTVTTDATILSTVCEGTTYGMHIPFDVTSMSIVLRNDTLVGGAAGLATSGTGPATTVSVAASNVIAQGLIDVIATVPNVTMTMSTSNYDSSNGTVTAAGSASNQTAAPTFASTTDGFFRQAPNSPTIDAGSGGAANGTADIDGHPRPSGTATDIGADEFVLGAPLPTPPLAPPCANAADDDGDGFVDAADPQCAAGRGREAPRDNPILACSGRSLTLTDVLPEGQRVRLAGLADPVLAGREVQLLVGRRVVARTKVRGDGSFGAAAPRPRTTGARFQARIAGLRSKALKVERRTIDARVTRTAAGTVLSARVSARRRSGATVALLARRACGAYVQVASAKLRRDGRLRIRLPRTLTSMEGTIVVRARIRLSGGRVTYTLPRAITLQGRR
jgi:hypothetical protein